MPPRPSPSSFLDRLTTALAESRVRFTWKAEDEILELGWSDADARDVLAHLTTGDFLRTEPSRSVDFTLIWVFCPLLPELDRHLWIRFAEDTGGTLVIRFHLAAGDPWT